eukprot:gene2527-3232_t
MDLNGKILSLQSHVVHGYVGNRSAVFPLQLLGFEVDVINSVQFSNHTGYKSFKGERLTGEQLEDLITGLEENNLINYSHLLTGYIGSPSFLEKVVSLVEKLKKKSDKFLYVCDPVIGDYIEGKGKTYVPKELIQIYQEKVIKNAHILMPNRYEAEILSNKKIENLEDAKMVCDTFHEQGISIVVLKSLDFEKDYITIVGSQKNGNKYKINVKRVQGYFTGTGDLIAALILATTTLHKDNFKLALEKAVSGVQQVISETPTGSELCNL